MITFCNFVASKFYILASQTHLFFCGVGTFTQKKKINESGWQDYSILYSDETGYCCYYLVSK